MLITGGGPPNVSWFLSYNRATTIVVASTSAELNRESESIFKWGRPIEHDKSAAASGGCQLQVAARMLPRKIRLRNLDREARRAQTYSGALGFLFPDWCLPFPEVLSYLDVFFFLVLFVLWWCLFSHIFVWSSCFCCGTPRVGASCFASVVDRLAHVPSFPLSRPSTQPFRLDRTQSTMTRS